MAAIEVGSVVQRKSNVGAVCVVTGVVISRYQVCGHPLRFHWGRERLTCEYKPRTEVGVQWRTRGARRAARPTHLPLSSIVLVED